MFKFYINIFKFIIVNYIHCRVSPENINITRNRRNKIDIKT